MSIFTYYQLNALKEEVEALNRKLAELTKEELEEVISGKSDIDLRKDLYENVIL